MAYKSSETWLNESGSIAAVKKKGGGYMYFVNTAVLSIDGTLLRNDPVVAAEISSVNLEMMEARRV